VLSGKLPAGPEPSARQILAAGRPSRTT
jgi:hypothetical protein